MLRLLGILTLGNLIFGGNRRRNDRNRDRDRSQEKTTETRNVTVRTFGRKKTQENQG